LKTSSTLNPIPLTLKHILRPQLIQLGPKTPISKPQSRIPCQTLNPKTQAQNPKSFKPHLCGQVNVKAREQVDHNLVFPVLCQKVNKLVHLLPRLAQHIQVAERRRCALLPLVRPVLRHGNLPRISQAGPRKCGYFVVHRGGEEPRPAELGKLRKQTFVFRV